MLPVDSASHRLINGISSALQTLHNSVGELTVAIRRGFPHFRLAPRLPFQTNFYVVESRSALGMEFQVPKK